ncbi:hypothetical protein [Brasilonema sp. UFV-L1]|nr:hypothetical protein [Brasilonema sp. UFV-L1]
MNGIWSFQAFDNYQHMGGDKPEALAFAYRAQDERRIRFSCPKPIPHI